MHPGLLDDSHYRDDSCGYHHNADGKSNDTLKQISRAAIASAGKEVQRPVAKPAAYSVEVDAHEVIDDEIRDEVHDEMHATVA